MLDIFKSLKSFGAQSYLGVDIGTTSIKIVEVSKGKVKPELKNYGILESYGHLERVNNAIQTSSLKIVENDTAELLKLLIKNSKFKTSEAVASIPSFAAFITLLEIPQMSDTEITSSMKYQLGQYVPLPASEVTIDWTKVGERQDEQGFVKEQILLISVPNEVIKKYTNIFKLAGLKLRAIEVESLSLLRSVELEDDAPTLIVDIGARSTNIVIAEQKALKYNYQTDFSGTNLTQVLSSGLGINIRRAEKIKKEKGLLDTSGSEISTLMAPFLDAILDEVRRAKNKYEQSFNNPIKRIILSGGGSKLLGIDGYFSNQFNLPVSIGDPFRKVEYPSAIEPLTRELGPSFAVAIGLGIKNLI